MVNQVDIPGPRDGEDHSGEVLQLGILATIVEATENGRQLGLLLGLNPERRGSIEVYSLGGNRMLARTVLPGRGEINGHPVTSRQVAIGFMGTAPEAVIIDNFAPSAPIGSNHEQILCDATADGFEGNFGTAMGDLDAPEQDAVSSALREIATSLGVSREARDEFRAAAEAWLAELDSNATAA